MQEWEARWNQNITFTQGKCVYIIFSILSFILSPFSSIFHILSILTHTHTGTYSLCSCQPFDSVFLLHTQQERERERHSLIQCDKITFEISCYRQNTLNETICSVKRNIMHSILPSSIRTRDRARTHAFRAYLLTCSLGALFIRFQLNIYIIYSISSLFKPLRWLTYANNTRTHTQNIYKHLCSVDSFHSRRYDFYVLCCHAVGRYFWLFLLLFFSTNSVEHLASSPVYAESFSICTALRKPVRKTKVVIKLYRMNEWLNGRYLTRKPAVTFDSTAGSFGNGRKLIALLIQSITNKLHKIHTTPSFVASWSSRWWWWWCGVAFQRIGTY